MMASKVLVLRVFAMCVLVDMSYGSTINRNLMDNIQSGISLAGKVFGESFNKSNTFKDRENHGCLF